MNTNDAKSFNLLHRIQSFGPAIRGLGLFIKTTHNAWLQLVFSLVTILLGMYVHITRGEWLALILALGLLLLTEALNTAIEVHMNLTSPEPHPQARDTKDIAAGAVLLASVTTLSVALVIFVPYILNAVR